MFLIMVLSDDDNRIIQMVYAKNKARLLHVAKSYLGSRAEDVVHDAFVKLIEKFDGKIEELRDKKDYYFVTIVKNYSIDIIRKEKNTLPLDIEGEYLSVFVDDNSPENIVEDKDELTRLVDLVSYLKPDYQQILEYKYILDFSNIEIAKALNVSESVVSTRISRARKELKSLMERGAALDR